MIAPEFRVVKPAGRGPAAAGPAQNILAVTMKITKTGMASTPAREPGGGPVRKRARKNDAPQRFAI